MLEQMRRQGASILVYLIFGLLIVIFIVTLAPSGNGGEGGCGTASNAVVTVDGVDANQSSYLISYSANGASGRQKVYLALDQIIRRELLAQAAEERGIRTTGDLVDEAIKRGYFFIGGQRIDFSGQFFEEVEGEKFFSLKQVKNWAASLNVSLGTYREEQSRGLQAAMMSDLLTRSVRVSRDEALANYLYENNTVTYDIVAFDPRSYRGAMRLTDADTRRFLDGHTAEVEARYKADERTYKGVKPQLALREIFIPKAAPEAAKPADDKAAKPADDKAAKPADDKAAKPAAAGKPPNPRGLPPDVAKAKLQAVRDAIAAGKLTFGEAEKQLAADASEDAPMDNGDRGWRSADNAGLGDKAVNDAVKALKPGEMTPVIVTENGAFLVLATDKREGDLSFDQVKLEIAATLAKDVWSKEAAKRAALDALAQVQAGTGKKLDQVFEREQAAPPGGIEEILKDPSIPQEQKQEILQRFLQQQKQGSLEVHEQDVPVAWHAEADGSANGTAAAPAAGNSGGATPPAKGSAAPAPAAGSAAAGSAAAGSAAAGSAAAGNAAAGAGSGSAAAPAPTPTPAPAVAPTAIETAIEASKDVLPQFDEIPKAKVNRLGPMPRQAKMPGVGGSKDAIGALFEELAPGDLAKKVYDGDAGAYVVLQLIDRSQPKVEDFEKIAGAEIARMQEARGKAMVSAWLKSRCETLTKAGKIRPAADRIRETDDKGNPAPTVYRPCMFFDYLDS
jgi:parvulin-like peptidyl-prolyl isomerase